MSRSPLTVPEHPELPPEVRQAYVEVDRKFGVFILPQLSQLGAQDAVERLLASGAEVAQRAAAGDHAGLTDRYQELLGDAQRELRQARTVEVEEGGRVRAQKQEGARLDTAMAAAKSRLPSSRLVRLESRLVELKDAGVDPAERVAAIESAVLEWERLNLTRQAREAERLADQAHLPIRPRQTETSRSRRALRDQARIVALARTFAMEASSEMPSVAGGSGVEEQDHPGQ